MPDESAPRPAPPPGERGTVNLLVGGPIAGPEAAALCARAQRLLEGGQAGRLILCDVAALTEADLGTLDALARLQLTARRLGGEVRLRHASAELREILDLAGLAGAVPCQERSGGEVRGEAEEREEPLRVEEEDDAADAIA